MCVALVMAAPAQDETIVGQIGGSDAVSSSDTNAIIKKLLVFKLLLG